ncbi:non-specific lipid-transfer protein 8-like [Malania oleifera]|uniref:non-specific lipid-transfer protein 8-like n=1 Tax=Malania oleifera TaxID=397392 RepID=UPI0025ADC78F|nr:non-specific lipid-transfer protein 8-like [Malania oleifera]
MRSIPAVVVVAAALAMAATLLLSSEAAISCSDVVKDLRPCVNYLQNGSGKPPPACCAGASTLASAASSSENKKAACSCIKSAAQQISIKTDLAKALPGNCGISLPFTVSPNVDCSKVG